MDSREGRACELFLLTIQAVVVLHREEKTECVNVKYQQADAVLSMQGNACTDRHTVLKEPFFMRLRQEL